MAHIEKLGAPCPTCKNLGRDRWGQFRVINDASSGLGFYCAPHAKRRLREFETRRDAEAKAYLKAQNNAPYHPIINPRGANPDQFGGSDF
jgi:hypothetical protein